LINPLLNKLLIACNKPDKLIASLKFNITKKRFEFYHLLPISQRRALHDELELLCHNTKALTLSYAPKAFGEENTLQSIEVIDARKLCNTLSVPISSDISAKAITQLDNIVFTMPEWLTEIITEIKAAWVEGKKIYQCDAKRPNQVIDACHFLSWLETVEIKSLGAQDIRTVSVKLFKDSKRLERLAVIIKSLVKNRLPDEVNNLKAIEVLAYIGISRFPPLFRVKGDINFYFSTGMIASKECWPNIGIPPDGITSVEVLNMPSYVIFIENQTTFERYTREINDNGLVFYTNGFPSRTWQIIYQRIEKLLIVNIPFYHWGDIDVGGYNILAFMQSLFSRDLTPHLMNPFDFKDIKSDKKIKKNDLLKCLLNVKQGPIVLLSEILYQSNIEYINWVEQEALDIIPIGKYIL
jgi:hypothetical protein